MHSSAHSEEALVNSLRAVVQTNEETARLVRSLVDDMKAQTGRSNSAQSVNVHAGGITNAIAVCMSALSIVLFIVFSVWIMWQVSDSKAQQEAWIQVWQQQEAARIVEHKKGN
jgi:hypothetical protein